MAWMAAAAMMASGFFAVQPGDQPGDQPAQPEKSGERAEPDRFPASRDYVAELQTHIAGAANKDSAAAWREYERLVYGVIAITEYAWRVSGPLQTLGDDENPVDFVMAIQAAAGLAPDTPKGVAAAGREILSAVERTAFVARYERVGRAGAFSPKLELVRPLAKDYPTTGGPARAAARLGAVLMVDARNRGETERFVSLARANLALARAVSSECALLPHVTGRGIEAMTLNRLMDSHLRTRFDAATAKRILEALREAPSPDWARSMHGERLIGLDAIDWGYARKPLKDLGIDVTMSEFLIRSKWVPRTEAMTFFDDAMNALVGVFADDKAEAERNLSKWNQALKVVEAKDAAARLMLPNVFLSGLDRARTLDAGIRVLREATATMCAIEIHRSERGDLPETLGDLVPKHLKSLPVDWHTAECKSLIYRRTPGEGVGYVLYSVGYDGKDDGGKDEPGVSRVGKEDGTDCVFTVPSLEGSGEAAK